MRLLFLLATFVAAAALPAPLYAASLPSKDTVARYADQMLTENYTQDSPGATVIVARGDQVLFRGARGMSDVEHATPLKPGDLLDIGSITKQFTAAGLLKLVEAGKVSLDDPLSKFIKDCPGGNTITVLELLNHTSGVKDYSDTPGPQNKPLTIKEAIDSFKNEKPDFAPGKNWAYDNSGYLLISAVIEAVSGVPWHVYLQKTLFDPLGLAHTRYSGDPAVAAGQMHGYKLVNGKPMPAPLVSQTRSYGDGALISNVDDLLKWNRALHEGHVLHRATYREMITPVGAAAAEQYGLGISHTTLRGHDMLGHSGHISGYSAYLLYLPQSATTVAILQNMDRDARVTDPEENARKLAAFAIGKPYPAPQPIAVDAATLRQAEGAYGTDPPGPRAGSHQGRRLLRVADGGLTIARTADYRFALIPLGPDTFQSTDGLDRIDLVRNPAGVATAIRFFPRGEGEGQLLPLQDGSKPNPQIALPPDAQTNLTGSYLVEGMEARAFMENGLLKLELVGQDNSAATLLAESPRKFFAAEVDAAVEFTPAEGKAQSLTVHQSGENIVFQRK
ncbi:MAG TPA: serine hydrolase domain-containing protein [Rhizomicrobium sp.]|jgi:CubicO group peptidase (beta-lactamase class C family)